MRSLKSLNQENLLFFDIETSRLIKELEPDTPLYDSWEYKVNKDGKMTQQEIIESYEQQSALYPEFAKVISIVVGKIVKDEIVLVTLDDDSEFDLLTKFNNLIERNIKCTLVGFANIEFDTPFVMKRMLINGIEPHDKVDSSGLKPWTVEEVDLKKEWQGTSFNRASLLNIATAFNLPSPKDDISGADVGKVYWNEGKEGLARISEYCRKDVATTINIFRKMRLQEALPVKATAEQPVEMEFTLIEALFNGGAYGAKEKEALLEYLRGVGEEDREAMFTVLDSITSTASGKRTKITKVHVNQLRKEVANG